MDNIYTITKHLVTDDTDQVETFVAITEKEALEIAHKIRHSFKEEYFDGNDDDEYDECADEYEVYAWRYSHLCKLEILIEKHTLSSSSNEVNNDITDIGDIVGKDFVNAHYMVLSDSGFVYNEGDIVTTLSLAEDFIESCNEVEEADFIERVHYLLQNNKGDVLVKSICEWWYGLNLKKID